MPNPPTPLFVRLPTPTIIIPRVVLAIIKVILRVIVVLFVLVIVHGLWVCEFVIVLAVASSGSIGGVISCGTICVANATLPTALPLVLVPVEVVDQIRPTSLRFRAQVLATCLALHVDSPDFAREHGALEVHGAERGAVLFLGSVPVRVARQL